jgi:hypothetical protein
MAIMVLTFKEKKPETKETIGCTKSLDVFGLVNYKPKIEIDKNAINNSYCTSYFKMSLICILIIFITFKMPQCLRLVKH